MRGWGSRSGNISQGDGVLKHTLQRINSRQGGEVGFGGSILRRGGSGLGNSGATRDLSLGAIIHAAGRAATIPFFLILTLSRNHAYAPFLTFTKV